MSPAITQPDDEHDATLLARVRPRDWMNPTLSGRYNLVVIGAGTAGLVTVAGAAGLGAKVALVERGLFGGDCLNTGCVPSKALLRSARAVAEVRSAHDLGVRVHGDVQTDFGAIMSRMRALRAQIAEHDAVARFQALGVDVFLGEARFSGRDSVRVDGVELRFARACIATGSRPRVPPIEGLQSSGYLTNETLFDVKSLPRRLAVVGGGPIGCEMA